MLSLDANSIWIELGFCDEYYYGCFVYHVCLFLTTWWECIALLPPRNQRKNSGRGILSIVVLLITKLTSRGNPLWRLYRLQRLFCPAASSTQRSTPTALRSQRFVMKQRWRSQKIDIQNKWDGWDRPKYKSTRTEKLPPRSRHFAKDKQMGRVGLAKIQSTHTPTSTSWSHHSANIMPRWLTTVHSSQSSWIEVRATYNH